MVSLKGKVWWLTAPFVGCSFLGVSCEQEAQLNASSAFDSRSVVLERPEEKGEEVHDELYRSLASKMARMEELLNAIERFIGDSNFEERLLADAGEFHELLFESRVLFPEELAPEDRMGFTQAMEQTLEASTQLQKGLSQNDVAAAELALAELHRLRKKSHVRFSY